MAVDTSQFKNGLRIEIDGEPLVITYFQHVKPGKGGAFVRTKLKNLRTGRSYDQTFRAGERVQEADVEDRRMQYLYLDGDSLVFMDTQTYDQLPFSAEVVGDIRLFLKENTEVDVLFWKGRPINIDLPNFIEAEVTKCDPGVKGDTASGATKPATIETGASTPGAASTSSGPASGLLKNPGPSPARRLRPRSRRETAAVATLQQGFATQSSGE
jgi:elongation factor P